MQGDTRSFWGWDVGTFGNHSSVPHRCFPRRPHRGEGSALGLGAHLICKFIGATPGTEPQRGGGGGQLSAPWPSPPSSLPWGPSACIYAALRPLPSPCLHCLEEGCWPTGVHSEERNRWRRHPRSAPGGEEQRAEP